ncbi:hypothetical protein C8Q79DRAFT_1114593 [Trametes meyenii]|nr:hypothetical protein C8Q79DRAFT_1114593 [Trametes meyenii]
MRSPVLAFSLIAAATASAAAQASPQDGLLKLGPHIHTNARSLHLENRRAHPAVAHSLSDDNARNSREPGGRQSDAQRAGRPEPPHLRPDHDDTGVKFPVPVGSPLNGGTSDTALAVGSDAGQGGGTARSSDGAPVAGQDTINIGKNITSAVAEEGSSVFSNHSEYVDASKQYGSGYTRMRRMSRPVNAHSASKYADSSLAGDGAWSGLALAEKEATTDDSGGADDSSGTDGADGTSTKGIATPGSGPNGGHAETGEPGSSKGGHVYNSPSA